MGLEIWTSRALRLEIWKFTDFLEVCPRRRPNTAAVDLGGEHIYVYMYICVNTYVITTCWLMQKRAQAQAQADLAGAGTEEGMPFEAYTRLCGLPVKGVIEGSCRDLCIRVYVYMMLLKRLLGCI